MRKHQKSDLILFILEGVKGQHLINTLLTNLDPRPWIFKICIGPKFLFYILHILKNKPCTLFLSP